MRSRPHLYQHLAQYTSTDYYPFHMPGHKRRTDIGPAADFPNPYGIDVTEIEGFDNLHHAEGIIRESMDWAAELYGADRTYYLVNGSTGGILSAISGTAAPKRRKKTESQRTESSGGNRAPGGCILMSRSCHKSAYHGVFLNRLRARYIYPQFLEDYGVSCGFRPEKIREMLKTFDDISSVLVVSPTYDGVVSDIGAIAEICHSYQAPLIVDEAHGAHFRYGDIFPASALELGADVVIQSVHKTLPCFTQSALLHLKEGYVDREEIEHYLQIYQSSSPSYVLMAGIEQGIWWMETKGRGKMREYARWLLEMRQELGQLKHLKLLGKEVAGMGGIYDMDISKVIISTKGTGINGAWLCRRLREEYHLEMEMCTEDYVTAITTVMDEREGIDRLKNAILEIDKGLGGNALRPACPGSDGTGRSGGRLLQLPEAKAEATIYEAWNKEREAVLLEESAGRVAAEFIYLYPPGIPIIVPGERVAGEVVETILRYRKMGLPLQGMRDRTGRRMDVIK